MITSSKLRFSKNFWQEIAQKILAQETPEDSTVLVPTWQHANLLRDALAGELRAHQRAAFFLPRITPLLDWVRDWAQSHAPDLGVVRCATLRRMELFHALQQTTWLAQALTNHDSAALWSLARQLLALADQLTLRWGSVGRSALIDVQTRLLALIKGHYGDRAWESGSPEVQLVLSIWRTSLAQDDQAAWLLRALDALASAAPRALMVISATPPQVHEQLFFERYALSQTVEVISIDHAASLAAVPALAFAWPECVNPEGMNHDDSDLRTRAARLKILAQPLDHLRLTPAMSLEEQAVCAVTEILQGLDAGEKQIGVVVLDRMVARRMRALLERAEVLVRDETGWKISTSSAAGALMRCLQLVHANRADCQTQVLLDWLKSPLVWAEVKDKAAFIVTLETALRAHNVVRGWGQIHAALAQSAGLEIQSRLRKLEQLLLAPSGLHPMKDYFAWLSKILQATGMDARLSADAVGRELVQLLEQLSSEAQRLDAHLQFSFVQWRSWLGDALENTSFHERAIDSPVVFLSLGAARLQSFDRLIVVGADAEHFPITARATLFFNPRLLNELGVELGVELGALDCLQPTQQLIDLALLIATSTRVLCAWQAQGARDSKPLAAPLERLALLHRLAFADDLRRSASWPMHRRGLKPITRPAPATPRDLIPRRLSASAYNVLLSCPYRYYARYLLALVPLDEITEDTDKREYGQLVHTILQEFHCEFDRQEHSAQQLLEHLQQISYKVFAPLVAVNGAYLAWQQRWLDLTPSYIAWHREWRAQAWQFLAAEQDAQLDLDDLPLQLYGRLDRIDQNAQALAILDYKVRSLSSLRSALQDPGEDIQLPFYRLLLGESVTQTAYVSLDQQPIKTVQAEHDLEQLTQALATRLKHDWSRLYEQAPLPAHGATSVCVHCDMRGLCRKGYWQE